MTSNSTRIICDKLRFPATSEGGDWRDQLGHHRYYGSSVYNGGERIVERRRGAGGPAGEPHGL
jgi:hypothetical protein